MKIDLKKYGDPTNKLQKSFVNQYPYPHIILDDFLNTEDAENLLLEHCAKDEGKKWGAYVHVSEKKNGISKYDLIGFRFLINFLINMNLSFIMICEMVLHQVRIIFWRIK